MKFMNIYMKCASTHLEDVIINIIYAKYFSIANIYHVYLNEVPIPRSLKKPSDCDGFERL